MNTRVAFSIIAAVCFCVLGAVVLGFRSVPDTANAKAAIDVVDGAISGLIGALGGYAMARAVHRSPPEE